MRNDRHRKAPPRSDAAAAGPVAGLLANQTFLGVAAIVALTFLSYWPALRAGFIWDDDSMLTANPLISGPDGLRLIWFSTGFVDFVPLTLTSYWLEFRLWGFHPAGYHAVNIILHAMSGVLLWRVLIRLRVPGALFAALLFVVHPVNVESVAWIAQRKNTLALFFYALTLLLFLRFDEGSKIPPRKSRVLPTACYGLALLSFLLSLLSKSAGITLPAVLLLTLAWRHGRITRKEIWRTAPFFLLAMVMAAVAIWIQRRQGTAGEPAPGIFARIAASGWAAWFYVLKAWLPLQLCFVYPRWQVNPREWLAWGPNVAWVLGFALFWKFRRGWGKPFLFALGYYLLTLLPVLGFFHIYYFRYSRVADHYQYFSIVAMVALLAALFETLSRNWLVLGRRLAQSGLLLLCCLLTWLQARIYFNPEALWTDTLAKNPACWLAHNSLGLALANTGRLDEARAHYEQGLAFKPNSAELLNNLASVLLDQGKPAEALACLRKAIAVAPRSAMAYYNLGNVCDQLHQPQEAEAHYRHALELDPNHAESHSNLGCLLYAAGKKPEAVEEFTRAISLKPDYAEALNNLGAVFLEQGRAADAFRALSKAIQLQPAYADARVNLGNAWQALGNARAATGEYQTALNLNPSLPEAHYRLGLLCLEAGNPEPAARHFSAALQLQPDFAEAHYQSALLLTGQKQIGDAIPHLQAALRLRPDWPEALNHLAWIFATQPDERFRNGGEALRLARRAVELTRTNDAEALDTLAAACAEAGRFPEAVNAARRGADLARAAGQAELSAQIQTRLRLYQSQQPYRQP